MTQLRTFLLLFAIPIVAFFADRTPARGQEVYIDQTANLAIYVTPDSEILVAYLGAWNCPPCIYWKNRFLPKWKVSDERKQVIFHMVDVYDFNDMKYKPKWPEDLEWLRDKINRRGAPQFVVAVDKKIVLHAWGVDPWKQNVVPLVQKLIAAKRQ